jgi:hypothetical protein
MSIRLLLFLVLAYLNLEVYEYEKSLCICFRPVEVEQTTLEDMRNRAQLNSVALPSVSFYTFLNTHNG